MIRCERSTRLDTRRVLSLPLFRSASASRRLLRLEPPSRDSIPPDFFEREDDFRRLFCFVIPAVARCNCSASSIIARFSLDSSDFRWILTVSYLFSKLPQYHLQLSYL